VVGGEKKIMDIVALAKFQGQDYSFLIHVENQATNAPEFNRQMFRYFCSLFLKYDRPIYPIVVFSYNSPQRLDRSNFVIDFPDGQVLNFNYKIVQLNRKLGNLPEKIATRIKSLEPNQLDSLTEDLLDFQALDDLERWLSNS
jgi:Domain of unknown function (DUF4351)